MNLKEFKPTILFLSKFLAFYIAGSLLYGVYVTYFKPRPDPITNWVTYQTAWCLTQLGWPTDVVPKENKPTAAIIFEKRSIVTVYEGCNGINVIIIFVAFVFAFGPTGKSMVWFIALGIAVIHINNLLRIGLLFLVSLKFPDYLYITHKYLFTAFIYGVVLLLWMFWVRNFSKPVHEQ